MKRIALFLTLLCSTLAMAAPALAQQPEPVVPVTYDILPVALLLFWPLGFILLTGSAMPQDRAPVMAVQLLAAWGVAALAYFTVGFALQFGGIAQVVSHPDLQGLYWEWYPIGQSVGFEVAQLWGVLALQGWALTGPANTGAAYQLFAGHIALVGVMALLPASVLFYQRKSGLALLMALLSGSLLYPLVGNWVWGGGWLAHLGTSLGLGHSFVDFGGAGVIFLTGSLAALTALFVFLPDKNTREDARQPEEVIIPVANDHQLTVYQAPASLPDEIIPATPMPSAYLPLLGLLGAGFFMIGWVGVATGLHTPTAVNFGVSQTVTGGILAALSGALAAAAYSWLTTRTVNPLLMSRGLVAGLVVAAAGAPFIPPWMLALAGLGMGVLLPLLTYLFNQQLQWHDDLALAATYVVSALGGLLLVGLLANGQAGQGWNAGGLASVRQGVAGLVVAPGFTPDWPGQFQAQLVGIAAIAIFSMGISYLILQTSKVIQNAWIRSGLEISPAAPQNVEQEEVEPNEQI